MKRMLDYFLDFIRTGKLAELLPAVRQDRIKRLMAILPEAANTKPSIWLAKLNIHVLVQDAQKLPLQDKSVDWIFSGGVLEYIPEPMLKNILAEFRRTARSAAVMTHRLNLVDVYSYFDRKITTLNYLRYTDRQWHWFNSPLIWQSRLRVTDYRRLYAGRGLMLLRRTMKAHFWNNSDASGSPRNFRSILPKTSSSSIPSWSDGCRTQLGHEFQLALLRVSFRSPTSSLGDKHGHLCLA